MAGIYIHIPYCKQKCHYCDFHFSVSQRTKPAMLQALKKEIYLRKDEITEPIETIYFGGGTPSVLQVNEIQELLEIIYTTFVIIPNPEITLEANPDDLSRDYLQKLFKTSINRLSIGVQSFFDEPLRFMNRAHTSSEAINSIKTAQNIGFKNITIDLIYGLPELSMDKWNQTLETFLTLDIPHLSAYALTVEKKTALDFFIKNHKIPPLDEVLAGQHFELLKKVLKENGYVHYELSNFAKPIYHSKHNTSYWFGKKYYGFGPSAHSYTIDNRTWNISSNYKYIKELNNNILPNGKESLRISDRYNEYIMTGLRTIWGVSFDYVKNKFGKKYYQYLKERSTVYLNTNKLKIVDYSVGMQLSVSIIATDKSLFLIDGIIADLFWVE